MNMFDNNLWIWLLVGIIPYYISRQRVRNGKLLCLRALFWSLKIRLHQSEQCQWTLHVPLIERMRTAIWAFVMCLKEGRTP